MALVALFFGAPTLMLVGAAIRALVFRLPEPHGIRLTSREAPALIALLEDLKRSPGSPRIDRAIGTAFNASVAQVPRLAIFWPRNMLEIGFPLLRLIAGSIEGRRGT